MSDTLPITEARANFGSLVRRASHAGERITITDHGQPAAVLISARDLAAMEEALATARRALEDLEDEVEIAEAERAATSGGPSIPHADVAARFGLAPDGRPL